MSTRQKYLLLHILIISFVFLSIPITQVAECARVIEPVLIVDKQGKQVDTKTSFINLRSSYRVLSVSQVQSMSNIFIQKKTNLGFYGHSTINHDYEKKSINGDKVVIDYATGLMWHQSGSSNSMQWDKAKQWVRDLNSRGYAGYHDWRLPTLEDAASLLESIKRDGLYIDSVFSNNQEWSWTGDEYDSEAAWSITFGLGGVYRDDVVDDDNGVRPVRSIK